MNTTLINIPTGVMVILFIALAIVVIRAAVRKIAKIRCRDEPDVDSGDAGGHPTTGWPEW